jgi:hypothetical protein
MKNYQIIAGLTKTEEIKQMWYQNKVHPVSICVSSTGIISNNLLSSIKHI